MNNNFIECLYTQFEIGYSAVEATYAGQRMVIKSSSISADYWNHFGQHQGQKFPEGWIIWDGKHVSHIIVGDWAFKLPENTEPTILPLPAE